MEREIKFVGCRVRPFMENAFRHGFSVGAADGFADWDAYKFGKLAVTECAEFGCWGKVLENYKNLGLGPLIFCGPVETEPLLLEEASAERKLLNAPTDSIKKVRELSFLSDMAKDGITFPIAGRETSGGNKKLIIKKINGAGGTGIRENGAKPGKGEYLQPLLEGESIGATFLSSAKPADETMLIGITSHIMGEKDFGQEPFLYGGMIYPANIGREREESIRRLGGRVAASSGITGFWGADFIVNGGGIHLLEINPRFTASLELIANLHDIDIVSAHTAALKGSQLPQQTAPGKYLATAVCYAEDDCTFNKQDKWFEIGARDIPPPEKIVKKGEPILSLYANGKSHRECMKKLRELAKEFYKDLATAKEAYGHP